MKHGIQRWERSGQGDGGFLDKNAMVDEEEEDVSDEEGGEGEEGEDDSHDGVVGHRFGHLKKRPQQALDNRRIFFLMENQHTSSTCGKCLRNITFFSRQCISYMKMLDLWMGGQEFHMQLGESMTKTIYRHLLRRAQTLVWNHPFPRALRNMERLCWRLQKLQRFSSKRIVSRR